MLLLIHLLSRYSFGMHHLNVGVTLKVIHVECQKAAYSVGLYCGDQLEKKEFGLLGYGAL